MHCAFGRNGCVGRCNLPLSCLELWAVSACGGVIPLAVGTGQGGIVGFALCECMGACAAWTDGGCASACLGTVAELLAIAASSWGWDVGLNPESHILEMDGGGKSV
jgi:hypothetical protein